MLIRSSIVGNIAALLPVPLLAALTACGAKQTVTDLNASRGTLYSTIGLGAIGSSFCAPPSVTPPPPLPDVWWAGLDPQTRTKVVVGFQLWSHDGAPTCDSHRQDTFRGMFEYSLAPLTALSTANSPIQTRITDAALSFEIQGFTTPFALPGSVSCGSRSGGILSLMLLPAGTPVLTGPTNMNKVATTNGVPDYPTSTRTITPISTLSFGGPQTPPATITILDPTMSRVDVDVKNAVLFALNSGQSSVGFMLTGTGDAPTNGLTADVQVDCKTLVKLGTLTVKSN